MAGGAGAVRAGLRRLVGRRPRGQPGEVVLPSQRAHRLHPGDHRRGARPARHAARRRAVRRAGLRRHPGRAALGRSVRPARRRGHHGLARRPGADQHGCGGRPAADHRHPAAADLLRRLVAGAHHVRHRDPAVPGQDRAGGCPGHRGPGRDPFGAAGWPGARRASASCGRRRAKAKKGQEGQAESGRQPAPRSRRSERSARNRRRKAGRGRSGRFASAGGSGSRRRVGSARDTRSRRRQPSR